MGFMRSLVLTNSQIIILEFRNEKKEWFFMHLFAFVKRQSET